MTIIVPYGENRQEERSERRVLGSSRRLKFGALRRSYFDSVSLLRPCLLRSAEASSDALVPSPRAKGVFAVIREEVSRLLTIEERHR
jgi:hypothetical protein